jgi:hypothetical protein
MHLKKRNIDTKLSNSEIVLTCLIGNVHSTALLTVSFKHFNHNLAPVPPHTQRAIIVGTMGAHICQFFKWNDPNSPILKLLVLALSAMFITLHCLLWFEV